MAPRQYRPVRLILGAAALAASLILAGCGGGRGETVQPGQTPAAGPKLIKAGKIVTCTNLPYEPFQFQQGGKVVGFDVDLIDLVAKKLGVQQEILDIDFNVIKSGAALNAGKCDVAAAGMTITEERKANLDFSDPYFDEVLALMAPKGQGVKTLDDVKSKSLRLGVQAATTSLDEAKKKGLDPRQFQDSGKQLQALRSKQIDIILQDLPVVTTWLKKPEIAAEFEMSGVINTGAQYGFAVKKGGNPQLLEAINDTLAKAKQDGTYNQIYKKWFGVEPGKLRGT